MGTSANEARTTVAWDSALLDSLFREPMDSCVRLLIVRDMALIADDSGRAPIATLAQRFRNFFRKRLQEAKAEERPQMVAETCASNGPLCEQSLDWWQRMTVDRALASVGDLVFYDGDHLAFRAEHWSRWTPGFRKALRNIAEARLIEYFETRVDGGW
jgi:hypothetical protein